MGTATIGIVESRLQVEMLLSSLRDAGIKYADISVLLPDTSGAQDFAHETHTKAPEGAVTGATAGGILGGAVGVLAGIGAIAVPGIGPLIAAGPLMAALSGAAAGAALFGLTGALAGLGIPEIEAKRYEGKIQGGNILVAVHTDGGGQKRRVEMIFKRGGAHDVASANESAVP